jgi:hypothetical protein
MKIKIFLIILFLFASCLSQIKLLPFKAVRVDDECTLNEKYIKRSFPGFDETMVHKYDLYPELLDEQKETKLDQDSEGDQGTLGQDPLQTKLVTSSTPYKPKDYLNGAIGHNVSGFFIGLINSKSNIGSDEVSGKITTPLFPSYDSEKAMRSSGKSKKSQTKVETVSLGGLSFMRDDVLPENRSLVGAAAPNFSLDSIPPPITRSKGKAKRTTTFTKGGPGETDTEKKAPFGRTVSTKSNPEEIDIVEKKVSINNTTSTKGKSEEYNPIDEKKVPVRKTTSTKSKPTRYQIAIDSKDEQKSLSRSTSTAKIPRSIQDKPLIQLDDTLDNLNPTTRKKFISTRRKSGKSDKSGSIVEIEQEKPKKTGLWISKKSQPENTYGIYEGPDKFGFSLTSTTLNGKVEDPMKPFALTSNACVAIMLVLDYTPDTLIPLPKYDLDELIVNVIDSEGIKWAFTPQTLTVDGTSYDFKNLEYLSVKHNGKELYQGVVASKPDEDIPLTEGTTQEVNQKSVLGNVLKSNEYVESTLVAKFKDISKRLVMPGAMFSKKFLLLLLKLRQLYLKMEILPFNDDNNWLIDTITSFRGKCKPQPPKTIKYVYSGTHDPEFAKAYNRDRISVLYEKDFE